VTRRRPGRGGPGGDSDGDDLDGLTPLTAALDDVLRSMRAPSTRQLGGVFQRWSEAVGETVAMHATPVSLEQGRLVVEVDEPGWATQLRYLEAELLRKLAVVAGEGTVTSIELRVARGARGAKRGGPRHRGDRPNAS
jgi:predicted nucleic acid-binding Zn ribbon protein